MTFSKIEDAINDIKRGKMVIVVDDESRENEGDLVLAAEKATAHKINFMITHARGLVCVPIIKERLEELNIPLMVKDTEIHQCKFTISVDVKNGATTGISPADRSATIQALIDTKSKNEDFHQPGHMFPLVYNGGGVLARQGHTEASVDLVKLAGLYPAAVICEVINEDGTMATLPNLIEFSKKHNNMKIIAIDHLVDYIKKQKENKQEEIVVNG